MTRARAKTLLPVIQAWSEGKQIQSRTRNSMDFWYDHKAEDPDFWNEALEWRVKPEPREFIIHKPINAATTSDVFLYTVGQSTCAQPESRMNYEAIRVREVMTSETDPRPNRP